MDIAAGFTGWAIGVMAQVGAPGAGLAIALENLFPPLPSEAVLPLAGLAAGRGEFSLGAALVWTTLGSVAGAVVLYAVAAAVGPARLRAVVRRLPLVRESDLDRGEAWFARHGTAAVLLGRMVPVVRSVISVPAGVERMNPVLFVALTAAGSALWNAVFVGAGYVLGANWVVVAPFADVLEKVVIVAVGVALVVTAVGAVRRARTPGRHREPR
ncbi:DedA family protein [Actinomycetospora aeridis]|uniref:DedA family protein n=1 Tax=Actinomycetospora aeridis TaxID=3129231 RepID=A0ABU8N3I5_9PSEU